MIICKHCGNEVEESRTYRAYMNGELVDVCADCINEFFEMCIDCGEYYERDTMTEIADGDFVCERCAEDYATCEECGCYEKIENMRWADDIQGYICDSCFNDYYEQCDDCGRIYRRDDMQYIEDGHGYYVCQRCLGNYAYCESCGDWHHIDNMHWDDYREEWYCDSCWEDREDGEILDYHGNYGWTEYRLPEEDKNVLLIGHELEIEPKSYDYNIKSAINGAKDNLNCVLEHDGSLNDGGFEIVSQPQSYEYIIAHYEDYKRAFKQIIEAGYVSHDGENCGLHFHFTAPYKRGTDERETVLSRLWLIVETYKEQFEKISRRGGHFRWCHFLSEDNSSAMLDGIWKMKKVDKDGTRYLVINNENSKTIELRLFKGTLNINTFYADLQFAHNLFTLAYNLELPITEIDWAKLTEGQYISKYCEEHELKTDRKITDNSIKYITLENKIMRLCNNIYNEYSKGMKKYTKSIDFSTKELNRDYLYDFREKTNNIGNLISNVISLKNYIDRKQIIDCIVYIKDLLNTTVLLDIDKEKMQNKLSKIEKYRKMLNN